MTHDRTVGCIREFVECVTSISSDWGDDDGFIDPWFRGIGNSADFKLVPRLYREAELDYVQAEARIRVSFASRALPYVSQHHKRESWDWYFLMQHYGVPTRLLDWTESALVALYFAIYARRPGQKAYPAVWVLDPFALNSITIATNEILVPSQLTLAHHLPACGSPVKAPLPVAVLPEYADRRMNAQQSKFTMHGAGVRALEDMAELGPLRASGQLARITIAAGDDNSVSRFKRALALLGVRNSSVYADLTGLAMDIREDYTLSQE